MKIVSCKWMPIYAPIVKPWYLRWLPDSFFTRRFNLLKVVQPGRGAVIYCSPEVYQRILKELMNG